MLSAQRHSNFQRDSATRVDRCQHKTSLHYYFSVTLVLWKIVPTQSTKMWRPPLSPSTPPPPRAPTDSQCFAQHELFIRFWCFVILPFHRSAHIILFFFSFLFVFLASCLQWRRTKFRYSRTKEKQKIKVSFFNLINDWSKVRATSSISGID